MRTTVPSSAAFLLLLALGACGGGGSSSSQPPPPDPPTTFTLAAGDGSVVLSWSDVSGATSYNAYWSTSAGVTPGTATQIAGVTSPFTQTGLINGTTYYYIVTAVNAGGESDPSQEVSTTPQGAPAPPATFALAAGDGEVVLTWSRVSEATSYNVYWSTRAGVDPQTAQQIADVTSPFTHTGLENGTTYYYVVTTVNAGGESGLSRELSATPEGDIVVTVVQPKVGALVGGDFEVRATVTSVLEITGVTATIAGREVALAIDDQCDSCGAWDAFFPIADLPRGEFDLVVQATAIDNSTGQRSFPVVHDEIPVISLLEPTDFAVARPEIHVVASCTDDDPAGCAEIRVQDSATGHMIAKFPGGSLDAQVSLAAFDGRSVDIYVEGRDSAGRFSAAPHPSRTLYVEGSPRLTEVLSVPGYIIAADAERVLYKPAEGTSAIILRDRNLGTDTVVSDAGDSAWLTSPGVVYSGSVAGSDDPALFEWKDGVTQLLTDDFYHSVVASGQYIIWNGGQPATYGTLTRRDLVADANVVVTTEAGTEYKDVASDGDVAYWSTGTGTHEIFRYDDGGTTQLTDDADAGITNSAPLTDGTNVLYQKFTEGHDYQPYEIFMYDGTTTMRLSAPHASSLTPGYDYALNAGWAAYVDTGPSGELQVWMRAPDGTARQVSVFNSTSRIEALGPNGEVAFTNSGRRHISLPPYDTEEDVSSGLLSSPYVHGWQDGKFYVALGATLFEITP